MFTIRRTRDYADWIKTLNVVPKLELPTALTVSLQEILGMYSQSAKASANSALIMGLFIGSILSGTGRSFMFFSVVATRVRRTKTFD
jgi:hypothetical protein